jgi:hypothetical protein
MIIPQSEKKPALLLRKDKSNYFLERQSELIDPSLRPEEESNHREPDRADLFSHRDPINCSVRQRQTKLIFRRRQRDTKLIRFLFV